MKLSLHFFISKLYIAFSLVISLIIVFVVFEFYTVDGASMSPSLNNNNIILCEKVFVNLIPPHRNEIVTIKQGNSIIIKRVIGIPGDKISLMNNNLYLNSVLTIKSIKAQNIEYILNDKEYFVIGDNYDDSIDGRNFGPINKNQILSRFIMNFNDFI